MFRAGADEGPAKGTRSSRRRPRPESSERSVRQPKAKRQRRPLAEKDFVEPAAERAAEPEVEPEVEPGVEPEVGPEVGPEMEPAQALETKPHMGGGILATRSDGIQNLGAPWKEVAVRPKKPKDRPAKADLADFLTSNNAYTVSRLPALPEAVRADGQHRHHGTIDSASGYALALTHTHAYVWAYTTPQAAPDQFAFELQYPAKHASDPLPLGSLVSPSASSEEPGLVVVMSVSGKVAYWESISSAATLNFIRQQRSDAQESISAMYSGEYVSQLINAEPAAYLLVFSTGRLAYMKVRDGHGRPAISLHFLREGVHGHGGGILDSLRYALTLSAIKPDLVAVRASQTTNNGDRNLLVMTARGKLRFWQIHRRRQPQFQRETDIADRVLERIRLTKEPIAHLVPNSLEFLDFSFVPPGLDGTASVLSERGYQGNESHHLLLLVSLIDGRQSRYFLVEVRCSADSTLIGCLLPISVYTRPIRQTAAAGPRLHLPRPGTVVFVVFDRAVLVISLAAPPRSPDASDAPAPALTRATFEDVIHFKNEDSLQIVASGSEEPNLPGTWHEDSKLHRPRSKNPAVVLLVQTVGLVRVSVLDLDGFNSSSPPAVTAKSKLEQAVYFAHKRGNPLFFHAWHHLPFTNQDICAAAVAVSQDILGSESRFIPSLPASMDSNLKTRMAFLDELIAHLNLMAVDLDPPTRWILLHNAEKMTVAAWMWQKNEDFLARRANSKDKKTILYECAMSMHDSLKSETDPAVGEVDIVRHWFLHDVSKLDIFIAWAYQTVKYTWTEDLSDFSGLDRFVWEAATINNGALQLAHQYRHEHRQLYGLDVRQVPPVPPVLEPWCATLHITNNLKRLIEFSYGWLDLFFEETPTDPRIDPTLLMEVRDMLPSLTGQLLAALKEYVGWASASADERERERGAICQQTYDTEARKKVLKLKDYDLWEEACDLAEEHELYGALADVMVQQILKLRSERAHEAAETKEQQMGELMGRYGQAFAFEAYDALLRFGGVEVMLGFHYDKYGFATEFLRLRPELARISWINDVARDDTKHAAETLFALGLKQKDNVWKKKIELSLGKLALLAEESPWAYCMNGTNGNGAEAGREESKEKEVGIAKIDAELELIKVQEALFNVIYETVHEAVDESAAIDMALMAHARAISPRHRVLADIIVAGLQRLLRHEALAPVALIDLLTLMQLPASEHDMIADNFFLALKVAEHGLTGILRTKVKRLIWRRCFLADDWEAVNETNEKNTDDQLEILTTTVVYRTLCAIFDEREPATASARPPATSLTVSAGQSLPDFSPIMTPSEAADVFTELAELDDGKPWPDLDRNQKARLLEAMKEDDARLRVFITRAQLDGWMRTTLEHAVEAVRLSYGNLITAKANAGMAGLHHAAN